MAWKPSGEVALIYIFVEINLKAVKNERNLNCHSCVSSIAVIPLVKLLTPRNYKPQLKIVSRQHKNEIRL